MACTLLIRGGNIDLHEDEAFNKVQHRIEAAKKHRIDYELGNADKFDDGNKTKLLFFTDLGEGGAGRIYVDVADCFGVMSDEYRDGYGSEKPEKAETDDDDDDETEDEE